MYPNRGSGLDAVGSGHFDVEQADLRAGFAGGVDHLVASADLGDDLEIGFEVEQCGERAPNERLVVGEE